MVDATADVLSDARARANSSTRDESGIDDTILSADDRQRLVFDRVLDEGRGCCGLLSRQDGGDKVVAQRARKPEL